MMVTLGSVTLIRQTGANMKRFWLELTTELGLKVERSYYHTDEDSVRKLFTSWGYTVDNVKECYQLY